MRGGETSMRISCVAMRNMVKSQSGSSIVGVNVLIVD